jgi:hypothetical protein
VIDWWGEDILAKGSWWLPLSNEDGGTFRWVVTQRRGCDLHPTTTEPMGLYFNT